MEDATVSSPCRPERLQKLAVSDTGFVFDPQTGQSFTLNSTGLMSLNLLKKGTTVENTAACLAREYGVSVEVASSSLEAFLVQFGRYL
jgi:hypothetical protein